MSGKARGFDNRQSMKNKSFEIFHYLDRKPPNVGVHHHDYFEIYYLLNGQVRFLVEGQQLAPEPGDLLLIHPQELHQAQIQPDSPYERIVLWIDRNYLSSLSGSDMDLSACFDRSSPAHTNFLHPSKLRGAELRELLERLCREFYSKEPGSGIYARGLLLQFMVEVNRLADDHGRKSEATTDLISQVLAYIAAHYEENISLESLAGAFFVSKYHLSHQFSRRVGTSVYRYIIFRRLMRAKELMAEGMSPGEVYQSCGFGDYANFYRAFKKEYGISPKEFSAEFTP